LTGARGIHRRHGNSGQPSLTDLDPRNVSAHTAPSKSTKRPSFKVESGVLIADPWTPVLVWIFPLPATQNCAEPAYGSMRPKRPTFKSPRIRMMTFPRGRIAVGEVERIAQISYSPGSNSSVPLESTRMFP